MLPSGRPIRVERRGMYSQQIDAATGGTRRQLSPDEVETLRNRFIPEAVPADLPGHGVVHLRMAHGVYRKKRWGRPRRTGIRGARGLITVLLFTSPR